MGNLQIVRKRFILAFGILAAVNLVLLVYLLWPGSSVASQTATEQDLQQQYRALSREVAPLRGIDQKLLQTRSDIASLYRERIPSHSSQISQEVEKLVHDTGVSSQAIRYVQQVPQKGDLPDVQLIEVETSITGEYAKVARFINALEQDKLFFVINQITLNSQEGGQVTLQIKFETFLKQAAQAGA